MGGQQAFQWASYFPDMVENMISMCGHAKTTEHTYVFLEGVYAALTSDPNWNSGNYEKQPQNGKTTMARVWAGWAHGQDWFREKNISMMVTKMQKKFWINFGIEFIIVRMQMIY